MDIPIAAAYVQIKRQRLRRQSVFLRRRIHYRLQIYVRLFCLCDCVQHFSGLVYHIHSQ